MHHIIFIRLNICGFITLFVQQHHDAVSVGVAVEMSGDHVTEPPEDGDQPLVVALPDSRGVSSEWQVTDRHVSDDEDLGEEDTFKSQLR